MTVFFERSCEKPDEVIDWICALHSQKGNSRRRVHFSLDPPEIHEVTPYSETYRSHPHFILANKVGWIRLPARADYFTGQTSVVMSARRKEIGKLMRSKSSKDYRLKMIETANAQLFGHENMDVDDSDDMDVDSGKVCATRTKPAISNKYAKRMGAKKAKKLEIAENALASDVLSSADATMYRALSARCNYLSQDRPDIAYSFKELRRGFAVPTVTSFKKLKRLARYLSGMSRICYHFPWQEMPTELDVYVDTDFAGCRETRRSTSGGVAMIGKCCIKHWSKTQTTISLSSGEAELHGIAYGAAQALGIQSLMKDAGWKIDVHLHSDATAAIGIARRKGLGKIRHLDCTDLWIQDKIRSKNTKLSKVLGTDNMADVLTKYVDKKTMDAALVRMNLIRKTGRPACAPVAMGA